MSNAPTIPKIFKIGDQTIFGEVSFINHDLRFIQFRVTGTQHHFSRTYEEIEQAISEATPGSGIVPRMPPAVR
jgi:hypothetical protein